jgi:hypothetical protein
MGDLKHLLTGNCRMNIINIPGKPKYIKNDKYDSC